MLSGIRMILAHTCERVEGVGLYAYILRVDGVSPRGVAYTYMY